MCWCTPGPICCGSDKCRVLCRQHMHRESETCKWCALQQQPAQQQQVQQQQQLPEEKQDTLQLSAEKELHTVKMQKGVKRPLNPMEAAYQRVFAADNAQAPPGHTAPIPLPPPPKKQTTTPAPTQPVALAPAPAHVTSHAPVQAPATVKRN